MYTRITNFQRNGPRKASFSDSEKGNEKVIKFRENTGTDEQSTRKSAGSEEQKPREVARTKE